MLYERVIKALEKVISFVSTVKIKKYIYQCPFLLS